MKKRPHIDPHAEERDYKHEISKLKRSLREPIDFAFVPVDPGNSDAGELKAALWFIRELHPQYLIAMHFWDDFDIINRLNEAAKGSARRSRSSPTGTRSYWTFPTRRGEHEGHEIRLGYFDIHRSFGASSVQDWSGTSGPTCRTTIRIR